MVFARCLLDRVNGILSYAAVCASLEIKVLVVPVDRLFGGDDKAME